MRIEKFRYLQSIIAVHKNQVVFGRTRLQKTVRLLQRVGFPTDYHYTLFFYGPYSEGLHFDLGLLQVFGAIEEEKEEIQDGRSCYAIKATDLTDLADIKQFESRIHLLENKEVVILELASTYDAYREMNCDHTHALERLRRKKAGKCTKENLKEAFSLLKELRLPVECC